MVSKERELDVVVFGATGFVGRLTAAYLAEHSPARLRVGLAGRSQERLAAVRSSLGATAAAWPLIVADSDDAKSLNALAARTRVVATTVGPYRRWGMGLVRACVEAGTHYADLTGEVAFMRESIDTCHDAAARAGVRIVHACGFDSIPSDLGVLLLHQAALADGAGDLEDTTLVVAALKGGLSGGTIDSMRVQLQEARADAGVRRLVADAYSLSPDRSEEPDLGDERDLMAVRHDAGLRTWMGPFVMAGSNTRVVRRSNALQGWAYGRRFRYREVTGFGSGVAAPVKGAVAATGIAGLVAGLSFAPTRAVLDRVLPSPGEGPSEQARRTGFFRMEIHTRTSSGARYVSRVSAKGDPGYAATSLMLGEAAICLARDELPERGGVLTPAVAMGSALVDRLRTAGMTLTVTTSR
ncbi:MAG TPA: saccharopine dehydrogenase NADP-binding domain-containing protein [Candidatus Acidoferrales bacterium]|nr:saccharopine dehydrogenase NADP-binding domain-containing protein [Candidatus Acidoferrales bacterium]